MVDCEHREVEYHKGTAGAGLRVVVNHWLTCRVCGVRAVLSRREA